MFPFTITLKRIIDFNEEKEEEILIYFKKELKARDADYFTMINNELRFKNDILKFGNNLSLMAIVDSGIIKLNNLYLSKKEIMYKFRLIKVFVISILFAIFAFYLSSHIWIGLVTFLWLGVLNWIIAIIRNIFMFNELVSNLIISKILINNN